MNKIIEIILKRKLEMMKDRKNKLTKQISKLNYKLNKEEINRKSNEYYAKNKVQIGIKRKIKRGVTEEEERKLRHRLQQKAYYERNKDKISEKKKKYYEKKKAEKENVKKIDDTLKKIRKQEYNARYYNAHKEQAKEYYKEYYRKQKELKGE